MVSLQLRLSLIPSPRKLRRHAPHRSLDLKLSPRALSSTVKATTVNGHTGEDVLFNGTAPAHFSGADSVVLPAGPRRESMPRHVAVIIDGNRRWARMRGLPIGSGYEAGVRALRRTVELCCELGIRVLTVLAFSSDNWFRPKMEVDVLMALFNRGPREELQYLVSADVRFQSWETSKFLNSLQALLLMNF